MHRPSSYLCQFWVCCRTWMLSYMPSISFHLVSPRLLCMLNFCCASLLWLIICTHLHSCFLSSLNFCSCRPAKLWLTWLSTERFRRSTSSDPGSTRLTNLPLGDQEVVLSVALSVALSLSEEWVCCSRPARATRERCLRVGLAPGMGIHPGMAASKTRHNLRVCYDSDMSLV